MREQWEQESTALRAEVAALQQQVQALAAQQASANVSAKTLSRWRLSKRMRFILLPVFVLLTAGGVLYGAGAMDALFIDQSGNVGVGTTAPQGFQVVLPEKNKPPAPNAGITLAGGSDGNASIELRSKDKSTPYIDFASSSQDYDARLRLIAPGQLAIEGANVGIGTQKPEAKLDVAGSLKATSIDVRGRVQAQSLAFIDEKGEEYKDNWIGMADTVLDDKTKWLHIGGITDGADNNKQRRIALYANTTYIDGNVGIWTKEPKARLDVNGDIKATSVNGEKPPMIFEVGQKNDTTNWHHVEKDIGPLCSDADGCTMKFFLRHSLNDETRTILEQIYIEQPDKSNNKSPGLHGWARQLGGGDQAFILQTANKYEIVPHPWEWIWVLNYSHANVGKESNAFGGYQVQFMTHPHVTATVIIYDR